MKAKGIEIMNVNPTPDTTASQTTQAAQIAKDGTTASLAAGASTDMTKTIKISTLNDLKEQAPEVYKKMMEGIATTIINQMKDSEERRKKLAQSYKDD